MSRRPSLLANWWLLSRSLATVFVRVERARRQLLFMLTLVLLAAVSLGAMPLWDFLTSRPWLFFGYWTTVALLVIFVFALALLDLLAVRQRYRREMQQLRKQYKDAVPTDRESRSRDPDES